LRQNYHFGPAKISMYLIQFADYLLDKFPFRIEAIQTDGSEFQSAFHWHLADRGIRHIYIKPATPRLNGKVERSHRIDAEEFYRQLKGVIIDDAELFNDKLAEWQDYYKTIGRTAASAARPPTNDCSRKPARQRPPSQRSTSVAQIAPKNPVTTFSTAFKGANFGAPAARQLRHTN
jgi:hypothetical protein